MLPCRSGMPVLLWRTLGFAGYSKAEASFVLSFVLVPFEDRRFGRSIVLDDMRASQERFVPKVQTW